MNMTFYGTTADVIVDSGIKPADLGFQDTEDGDTANEQLTAKIEGWLTAAKAVIDTDRERDFTQELLDEDITEIPPCINDIATQIGINMAKQAMLNRDNPPLKVDEYSFKITDSNIFTTELQTRLTKCSRKPRRWSFLTIGATSQDEEDSYDEY